MREGNDGLGDVTVWGGDRTNVGSGWSAKTSSAAFFFPLLELNEWGPFCLMVCQ